MGPASVIEEFGTTYGNMMFGEAGIYQLTPADSGPRVRDVVEC
jgi:hypothetical protein